MTGGTADAVPELLWQFAQAQAVAAEALVAYQTTFSETAQMTATRRAELMRELAVLSGDPDALDRDSDVDIWGFHNGT
jgi:hypothetical protein